MPERKHECQLRAGRNLEPWSSSRQGTDRILARRTDRPITLGPWILFAKSCIFFFQQRTSKQGGCEFNKADDPSKVLPFDFRVWGPRHTSWIHVYTTQSTGRLLERLAVQVQNKEVSRSLTLRPTIKNRINCGGFWSTHSRMTTFVCELLSPSFLTIFHLYGLSFGQRFSLQIQNGCHCGRPGLGPGPGTGRDPMSSTEYPVTSINTP